MASTTQQLGVLRHPQFRLLWFAESASVIGDMIVRVAVALFVIDLTGSATDVGLVLAAYTLPLVGFLLLGGVIADRLPRHLVVVATDLVRFALHALLAILIVTGAVQIWHLVVIGTIFGSADAFFRPAITGLVPQTVPEEEIQEANAILGIVHNIAEFAGPALATVLVLGMSAAAAFAIDAATFLLSAALLIRVRPRERALRGVGAVADAGAGLWAEVREGFGEVRKRRWIWMTLAAFCVAVFAVLAPWFVVGPIVAREHYDSLSVFGLVTAAFGAGTIAGSLAAIRWRPRYPMRLGIAFVLPWPVGVALYAAGVTLVVVVPAVTISGAGIALFEVWWMTALAERIPPDKLSRVTSYDWMMSFGLVPAGYVLAGPLAGSLGAANVMLGGAGLGFAALALALLPRQTRELERTERSGRPAMPSAPPVPVA
jgi:predicted MFS family arabinose efflux permease